MHASIHACQNAQNMHAACAAEWPDLRAWWYFGSTCTRHPTKLSRHFLCWGFAAETFPADRGLTVYFCLVRRACMTDLCNDKKEIARPFFSYLKFKLKKIHSTFTAMCNSHSDHESPLHPDKQTLTCDAPEVCERRWDLITKSGFGNLIRVLIKASSAGTERMSNARETRSVWLAQTKPWNLAIGKSLGKQVSEHKLHKVAKICYADVLVYSWRSCVFLMEATQQTLRWCSVAFNAAYALCCRWHLRQRMKGRGVNDAFWAQVHLLQTFLIMEIFATGFVALKIFQSNVYRPGNVMCEAAVLYPSLSCSRLQWSLAISQPKQLYRPPETAFLARCLRTKKVLVEVLSS